ncbi:hypothetical protein O7627_34870 [Solwaraspora sp. WMMD1047]|uniref:hypothetical protein n=1 Tax=Solwaraspora sp. WMMD1047 TaxID=3016102 RepID=UPI0024177B86|nr:hypothetical protein [Solwaraspora sp. WMMD1047]MDG4834454.1 hypothetical protein [Solwaraspora sp. WMMD1047]
MTVPDPHHAVLVPYQDMSPGYPVEVVPRKSVGLAVGLELILGLFGIFGVGSIYAGRVGLGLTLMISFWMLFWVNFALIFLLIGLLTMPLTWFAYLVVGALLAVRGAERHNTAGAIIH